jgi:hypothetical protein
MVLEIVENNVVLSFPKILLANELIQKLLDKIEFELMIQKSEMTNQQANELSEEADLSWWTLNKQQILNRISNAEGSR